MSNIKIENSSFVNTLLKSAVKMWDVDEFQSHYLLHSKQWITYFRCVKLPEVNNLNEFQIKALLENKTMLFKNELTLSQSNLSSFVLKYQKLIISYPIAIFLYNSFPKQNENILRNLQFFIEKKLSISKKISLMRALAFGVNDFHQKNMCLYNLKPSNIIVVNNGQQFNILFSETRQSCLLKDGEKELSPKFQQPHFYTAPENLQPHIRSFSCDIWSLGLIYYELLIEQKANQSKLKRGQLHFPEGTWEWIKKFLEMMVNLNQEKRFKIKDVIRILNNAKLCYSQIK